MCEYHLFYWDLTYGLFRYKCKNCGSVLAGSYTGTSYYPRLDDKPRYKLLKDGPLLREALLGNKPLPNRPMNKEILKPHVDEVND